MSITHQDETSRSGPHRRIERILDKMQIGYVSEEPFSPYAIDIYLPEWHLGIEVDGPGHSPKKDAYRDGFLCKEYFLPVLRLKADILLPDAIKKIEDFIVQWATTSEERKHQYRNR